MAERALDPFQLDAVARVLDEWTRVRSTLIVLATGLGKTRCASEVLRLRAPSGRAMMIAHREELVEQAAGSIRRDAGLTVEIEMAHQRATVQGEGLYPASDVVIASVPTLHTGRLTRWPRNAFSTIIIDEAHHATAPSWRAIAEHFSAAVVLGLTATPDRSDDVGLGNIFASCAYEYGIREGIRDGFLAPINMLSIVCADLDISEIKVVGGDLSAAELDQAMSTDKVLHQIASPLVKLAGDRPTLVFTAGVEQAHRLSGVLAGYTSPERVIALDGKTPKDFRRQVIEEFKTGRIQFLINMGLFLEGFDAPATACIAMARPTKSRALYTQAVGRGTRGGPNRPVAGKDDCVAEGQRVLTDCGLVPIEQITLNMRLWDGVEYVSHDGAVCRGEQEVISYAGLVATPDHRVWTQEGWQAFGQCARKQTPIVVAELGGYPVRTADGALRCGGAYSWAPASLGGVRGVWPEGISGLHQPDAGYGGVSLVRESAPRAEVAVPESAERQGSLHQSQERELPQLRWSWDRVPVFEPDGPGAVGPGALGAPQGDAPRSDRERRPLRARQPAVGYAPGQRDQYASESGDGQDARVPAGTPRDQLLGRHASEHARCPRHDSGAGRGPLPQDQALQARRRVWDVLNAGPRHRFVAEGLLVSNCLVLDFVGNSGRHRLVNALDVLAGKPIVDERIRKLVEKKTGKGMDLEGALTAAEREIEKRDKAAAERKRAKVQADAAFRATQVDPFGKESKEARDPAQLDLSELGMRTIPDNGGDRASDKQLEFIRKMGLTLKRENTSKGQAGMLCQQLMLRMKRNQCTIGQARILRKYGARLNLTRPQAKQALDEIAKDGWKHISKNPDLWEKWGPRDS